ncbi:hypothetical protein GCM10025771_25950 [Niveibacterium umoris]|uniref:diguanylate cyclase n=1 Tax=Niveibacterium umoris TaxID=1193620 RepID=A0A840BMY6_9RHOO|nr:diguanylate cyclase [Niveibacterium umoris]MBB4012216.1 diguanylate cyclase (GGDEF)-like protein [Niveibacterium umoris]
MARPGLLLAAKFALGTMLCLTMLLLRHSEAAPLTLSTLEQIEILAGDHPNRAVAELRSIESEARKAPRETRAAFLSVQGYAQALAGAPAQAHKTAQELENLAAGDSQIAAEAMLVRASAWQGSGNLDQAADAASRALDSLHPGAPARLMYWAQNLLGSIAREQGRHDLALKHLQEAARLADENHWDRRRGMVLNTLAALYLNLRQYENAQRAIAEACEIARRSNQNATLASYKLTEANIHGASGARPEQKDALLEALSLARASGARAAESAALINLSDYFLSAGDYAAAIEHASQAEPIALSFQDWSGRATIQTNIGLARILTGQVTAGRSLVEAALRTYVQHGARNDEVAVLREYGEALRKAGQTDAALEILLKERALSEELLESEKQRVVLELQAQYESERKQREITLLNKENALKDATIRNHRLELRVWSLLALAVALAAVVIGLLYRRVRSTNRELAARNEQLAIQSSRDPLTGLYNRRYFQQRMAELDANPLPPQADMVRATYLIDIDHFKRINDQLGHPAGDAVLIAVAERLRVALREADMIVRWGGEEFVVFVPQIRPDLMADLARRIIAAISDHPIACESGLIPVTASIGYAPFPLPPGDIRLSWEREINLIDMALYLAKAHGRSRAYGVVRLLDSAETSIAVIEKDLEKAWSNGLVELVVTQGPPPHPVD